MPLISGSYDPRVGILVQLAVIPPEFVSKIKSQAENGTAPTDVNQLRMAMGLIDTGASTTCISKSLAEKVCLQPSGKTMMNGSTGQSAVDQYTFGVGFIVNSQQEPTGQMRGEMSLNMVQGCEFSNHGLGFDLLVGRDIICKGGLSLTFDGHWHLAF